MQKSIRIGENRTGIATSPIDSKAQVELAERQPVEASNGAALAIVRGSIEEADPVGTMPPPASAKGAAKSLAKKLTGRRPEMLINKLGERLAYERGGARLYDALILKCSTAPVASELSLEQLRRFRQQEAQHFALLQRTIEDLGADPTAQTPDADVSGVAAMGLQKVISDPRTSVAQCLEAMLVAELTDNAAWELLITLTRAYGLDEAAESFNLALRQEKQHLHSIREWYEQEVNREAGLP